MPVGGVVTVRNQTYDNGLTFLIMNKDGGYLESTNTYSSHAVKTIGLGADSSFQPGDGGGAY